MTTNDKPAEQPKQNAVVRYENIAENVMAKIKAYEASKTMILPQNYAVENQLKSAWLMLQDTVDSSKRLALEVCTKDSIANALLDMVLQGLSVLKKQAYFVVYGNKLTCVRSYFGTVSLAKQAGGVNADPVANVIYEGDAFKYTIDPKTGHITIDEHIQDIDNINIEKIKGAYCILQKGDISEVTIMTMAQIRKAWEQGPMKGNSQAHKNFADQMCIKTVIGRGCKMAINASNDAWMYEGMKDELDTDTSTEQRNGTINKEPVKVVAEEVTYEEVGSKSHIPEPEPNPENKTANPELFKEENQEKKGPNF